MKGIDHGTHFCADTLQSPVLEQWLRVQRAPALVLRQILNLWEGADENAERQLDGLVAEPVKIDRLAPLTKLPKVLSAQLPSIEKKTVAQALAWLQESADHFIVTRACRSFPPDLLMVQPPVVLLFGAGNLALLKQPLFAIVGSRNASPHGREHAALFSRYLSMAGFVICSGGAMGIDGAAHRAALEIMAPTVAVLGSGIDNFYPTRNRRMLQQISEDGLIVSEYGPGTPVRTEQFPLRNRIISGLSCGVLVVEAAAQSGSLHTARYANEFGREVFALPGSLLDPGSAGPHRLIQDGAKLVTRPEEVAEELQHLIASQAFSGDADSDFDESDDDWYDDFEEFCQNMVQSDVEYLAKDSILASVGFETTAVDAIIASAGQEVSEVMHQLISLELDGWIKTVPGGYVRVRR